MVRRVAVTGLGIVAPQCRSIGEFWNLLIAGNGLACSGGGFAPAALMLPAEFNAGISEFETADSARQKAIRKNLKVMSREIQMAVAASCRALTCAGISVGQFSADRVGISFGSDYIITTPEDVLDGIKNCTDSDGFRFGKWGMSGLAGMQPLWQLKYLPNMPASHIAILNDFHGPSNSITLREASVGAVIGESVEIIKSGRADIMVAGTTGSRLHPFKFLHARLHEELTQTACRPFDLHRDGTVLGEGAGSVILEDWEHAERRGAKIWAEILCGSYRFGRDCRSAVCGVLKSVLRRSNMLPENVGHVNAHGLGVRELDFAEAVAIDDVFGKRQKPVPVTAVKSVFGNLGAGSGMTELIAGILSLQNQTLFPAHTVTELDPACPVALVEKSGIPAGDSFVKIAVNPQAQCSAVLVRNCTNL
ncbi:MAG: beta-ketoacyl-[acyl-carrier-protein] synthase family protein [Planctomycetaceae bacterium]|jgi:3-oxoacyl-[acyl-carrier-protein] synthase II|nr:beta-ketoacyl-[acyl-carrier-protein] synthase family protein [Planctomycetaceae bacterium]